MSSDDGDYRVSTSTAKKKYFLEAGDLVKFARYQPGTAEIDRAFDTAEAFVDQRAVEEPAADAEGPLPADATKSPQTGGGSV